MDVNLAITIISIIITLISILIAFYQIQQSVKGFVKSTNSRKSALMGEWKGKYNQNNMREDKEVGGDLVFIFDSVKRKIKGYILYDGDEVKNIPHNQRLDFQGGFRDSRYISLEYQTNNKSKIQYGNFILELSPTGNRIEGKFVGYGDESEDIVTGDVKLIKN